MKIVNKILNIEQATQISKQLQNQGKTVVLAGGVFDILHVGHVLFLQKAKKAGRVLFVLLENDETVKKTKGNNRPINSQLNRSKILEELRCVDYIVTLPPLFTDNEYDDVINKLKPDIIATTKNDPNKIHKERQAKKTKAVLVEVVDRISNHSTSKIANLILKEEVL